MMMTTIQELKAYRAFHSANKLASNEPLFGLDISVVVDRLERLGADFEPDPLVPVDKIDPTFAKPDAVDGIPKLVRFGKRIWAVDGRRNLINASRGGTKYVQCQVIDGTDCAWFFTKH